MDARAERADWYEVYDHEGVQLLTRQRVGWLLAAAVAVLLIAIVSVPVALQYAPVPLALLAVAAGFFVAIALLSRRLLRLRRVVWCVKLSVHRIVGYDYARRKLMLPWPSVERVEVDAEGLLVVGPPGGPGGPVVLRIPHLFADYPRLSHRVVEYAEAHGVPVCVEGRPWQLVDLSTLYPFMASVPVMERPLPGRDRGYSAEE
jgi:hypothetical protein